MTVAIILIVCCWIISFFFNGIESGLLSIDPVRLRQNVKRRCAGGFAVESPAQAPRTVIGDRSAHHKCGGHRRSALADKPAGSVVRLCRVFVRLGDCASGLFICFVGSS